MTRFRAWMIGLGVLAAATTALVADLSKGKPEYALLVFGPEAKTRVWVMQHGQTLYVDRNGDGDLTGKDERFTFNHPSPNLKGCGSLSDCNIEIRDPDGQTRYIITRINVFPEDEKIPDKRHLSAYVDIKGRVPYRQYCDAKLSDDPDKAAIAHFHGPLTIGARTINWKLHPEAARLSLGDSPDDLFAVVGTMDAERGCWVVVWSNDFPKEFHPVVEIEFAGNKAGTAAIKKRYRLEQRC